MLWDLDAIEPGGIDIDNCQTVWFDERRGRSTAALARDDEKEDRGQDMSCAGETGNSNVFGLLRDDMRQRSNQSRPLKHKGSVAARPSHVVFYLPRVSNINMPNRHWPSVFPRASKYPPHRPLSLQRCNKGCKQAQDDAQHPTTPPIPSLPFIGLVAPMSLHDRLPIPRHARDGGPGSPDPHSFR